METCRIIWFSEGTYHIMMDYIVWTKLELIKIQFKEEANNSFSAMSECCVHHNFNHISNVSVYSIDHFLEDRDCLERQKLFFFVLLILKRCTPDQQPTSIHTSLKICLVIFGLNSMLPANNCIFV